MSTNQTTHEQCQLVEKHINTFSHHRNLVAHVLGFRVEGNAQNSSLSKSIIVIMPRTLDLNKSQCAPQ